MKKKYKILASIIGMTLAGGAVVNELQPISLDEELASKTLEEKSVIKSDSIVAKTKKIQHTKGEYTLEIQNIEKIDGGVQIFARAWKNGQQLGFGSDGTVEIERFRIFNPPVLVSDDNGKIHRTSVDERGVTKTRNLREDPEQAIVDSLFHTIKLVGKIGTNITVGKVGNTTDTFYPSIDGLVGKSNGLSTYSALVTGTGDTANSVSSTGFMGYFFSGSSVWQQMYRPLFLFDTSSIPDTDTVSSATLSIWSSGGSDDTSSGSVVLKILQSNPASDVALATGDYAVARSMIGSSLSDSTATITNWISASASYVDFSFNATGIATVSLTGLSKYSFVNQDMINQSFSGSLAGATKWYEADLVFADTSGTSNDPKLVVVHSAASGGSGDEEYSTIIN